LRALAALDLRLLRLLRTRGHRPVVETALVRLARAGENGLLWNAIATVGGLLGARRRDDYVRAIEIVLITLLLNTAVKYTVRRRAPGASSLHARGEHGHLAALSRCALPV
jgi:hypothetical protein